MDKTDKDGIRVESTNTGDVTLNVTYIHEVPQCIELFDNEQKVQIGAFIIEDGKWAIVTEFGQ